MYDIHNGSRTFWITNLYFFSSKWRFLNVCRNIHRFVKWLPRNTEMGWRSIIRRISGDSSWLFGRSGCCCFLKQSAVLQSRSIRNRKFWASRIGIRIHIRVGRSIVDYFLRTHRRRCWGLWAERLAKYARQRPKLWWNIAAGRSGSAIAVEIPCRQNHLELYAEWKNMKIFEGLINSKNMIFNVKKLLNVGLGLTLRRKGGKNRCERNER